MAHRTRGHVGKGGQFFVRETRAAAHHISLVHGALVGFAAKLVDDALMGWRVPKWKGVSNGGERRSWLA